MHIDGSELTKPQRILTIADITSALTDNRSYKGEFSKEHTLGIINKMTDAGELDAFIVKKLNDEFDEIRAEQKYLQTFLKVDFSNVLKEYNDYLFNDADLITQNIEDITLGKEAQALEEIEEVEELGDVEELEEL